MNKYSADRLLKEYNSFVNHWGRQSPLNLRRPRVMTDRQGIDYGADSLYDHVQQKYVQKQEDFDANMDFIAETYTEQVIAEMTNDIKKEYLLNVGRVRFLALGPKECLTYHTDIDSETRFHIPIQTNKGAMFVINYEVVTMLAPGEVYLLDVQKPHTAINASREQRVHMVFDAYSN